MNVAFFGLGRMGLPMARNLVSAGFAVTVWNRTLSKCEVLVEEGARLGSTVRQAAAQADVVVTMVADEAAARAVLVEGGALDALADGAVVLEMSTIGPEAALRLADEARARGVDFLVDDIHAKKAELESKGVTFHSDVNVVDEGVLAGWRWVYFGDPDGYSLELVEIAYYNEADRRAGIAEYLRNRG